MNVSSTAGIVVGKALFGTGIAAGTTVVSIVGTTVTMSANATATAAAATIACASGEMRYGVDGSAPNREFVIQWTRMKPWSSGGAGNPNINYTFQIRLQETSNIVRVVFGDYFVSTPSHTPQVGAARCQQHFPDQRE